MKKAVLLVEDTAASALAIADALEEAGYQTIGPFASASGALASLAQTIPDCAVLDVILRDGTSVQIARALEAVGAPYVIHTGWPADVEFAKEFRCAVWLEKPVRFDDLVEALNRLQAEPKQTPRLSAAHC
jgi:DNA-binding NtrC family response regulator